MDADRFDSLAKRLVTPTSRRTALGTTLAGGLLGAFGLGRAAPEAHAAQGGTCVIQFAAQVRQGPSAGRAVVPNGARAGELRGELSFGLEQSGRLQNALLRTPGGETFPVVGQAMGHSLQLRIALGERLALVAVGVGEQQISRCQGAIDGMTSGPDIGDLGDWHATAVQQAGGGSGSQAGSGNAPRGNAAGNAAGGTAAGSGGGAAGSRTNRTGNNRGGDSSGTEASRSSSGGSSGSCLPGQTTCTNEVGGNYCANLETDPLNCGQCGLPCASELGAGTCIGGVCACSPGTTRCADVCVNTKRDPLNCGSCGNECPDDGECLEGTCAAAQTACPQGQTRCGNACVDTTSDAANCSACGVACAADERCSDSLCVPINGGGGCKTGLTPCGTTCANVQTDANNCGRCGNACAGGQECLDGKCTGGGAGGADCPPGETRCEDDFCVDLQTDPYDCGTCGTVCPPSDECVGGKCVLVDCGVDAAGAPLTNCGALCVNLQTSSIHCGTCGTFCATGQVCVNGACTAGTEGGDGCPAGQLLCGTECREALPNFGSDGLSCPGGGAPPTGCPAGRVLCNGACFPEGACQPVDCPPGWGYCYGVCRNFRDDPGYCGNCETNCPGQVCAGGQCVSCLEGRTPCGSTCHDLKTDLANCGGCGQACGTQCIDGQCTEVGPSPIDCGNIGESCADRPCCSGNRCVNGTCYVEAGTGDYPCGREYGRIYCFGICVYTQNDPNFCGACDSRCPKGDQCRDGNCYAATALSDVQTLAPTDTEPESADPQALAPTDVEPCPEGQVDCGGVCTDVSVDPLNCGDCGVTCAAGETCQARVCTATTTEAPAPPAASEGEDLPPPPPEEPVAAAEEPVVAAEEPAECLAAGGTCDPASPGACCSGACNDDGTCT